MTFTITTPEAQEKLITSVIEKQLKKLLPEDGKESGNEWINTEEFMERTGWSRGTITNLRSKKLIPYFKEGRKILFPWHRIESEYLEKNMVETDG